MIIELFATSAILMFTAMIYETYVLARQDWVINQNTPVYNLTMSNYRRSSSFCDEFKKVFLVYFITTLASLLIGYFFSIFIFTILLRFDGIAFIIAVCITLILILMIIVVEFTTTYTVSKVSELFYKTKKTVSKTTFSQNYVKFKEVIKDKYCPILKREY